MISVISAMPCKDFVSTALAKLWTAKNDPICQDLGPQEPSKSMLGYHSVTSESWMRTWKSTFGLEGRSRWKFVHLERVTECKCSREIEKIVLVMTSSVSTLDINRALKWTILKLKYIATHAHKMPSDGPSHMICYTRATTNASKQAGFGSPKSLSYPPGRA